MRLIRLEDVAAKTGMKRDQIYRLGMTGDFPKAVKLGLRSVAWVESEVDEWVQGRVEGRGDAQSVA